LQQLLYVARLLGFKSDPADDIFEVGPAMLAGGDEVLGLLELQIIETDEADCELLLNGCKGLQAEIGQSQSLFDVKVIDLHWPAALIQSQSFLYRETEVRVHEVLRARTALVPSGYDGAHFIRDILQVPQHGTGVVHRGGTVRGERLKLYLLVVLVPEPAVVELDPLFVDTTVGLDGTDNLPALSAA